MIRTFIEKENLLRPTDRVLVALSGGADSVALLLMLLHRGYTCVAAHCNFHLRGAESDADEQFVRTLCVQHEVKLLVQHFDTTHYAKEHKISIEMAARDLRYAWFEQMLVQENAQVIAVAHHADDQVETILLNLVRGAGLRGLCGMKPRNGNVIRPLLHCTRADIENYLIVKKQAYRTDSTNAETIYKRNKVRHDLVPMLEQLNPRFKETLCQNAQHIAGYWEMTQHLVCEARQAITHQEAGNTYIDIAKLHQLPAPETVLYELLLAFGFSPDVVGQVFAATQGISGKQFFAPQHVALKDREYIIIYPTAEAVPCEWTFSKNVRPRHEKENFPTANAHIAYFDAHKMPANIELRPWREGDRFAPIGMGGRVKKVSDFFTDQKLTLQQKRDVRLLASGDEVLWIIGYRVSDTYKVTNKTTHICEVKTTKEL